MFITHVTTFFFYQTVLSLLDLIKLLLTKEKSCYMNNEHLLINEEIDLNERI